MPRYYSATMQFRTTLDQAGTVARLAGELDISEAEVLRRLLDRGLEDKPLKFLQGQLAEERILIQESLDAHERRQRRLLGR